MSEPTGPAPARFGPFHRLASPTQTAEVASFQRQSAEIWGRAPRLGIQPQVKAYDGPLPADRNGIEFWTDRPPDPNGHPSHPTWGAAARGDVRVDEPFAKIPCVVTLIRYEEHLR